MQGDSESGNPNQPCISTLPNSFGNDSKRQLAGQRRQLRMSYHFGLGDRGPDYTSRVCKQRSSQTAVVKASSRSITNLQQTAACQSRARRGCSFQTSPCSESSMAAVRPEKNPAKKTLQHWFPQFVSVAVLHDNGKQSYPKKPIVALLLSCFISLSCISTRSASLHSAVV